MPIEILMPALSPTMTEGNLVKWLKKEGDAIKAGDVMAEIETDKATMEVEAVDEGTLGKILVSEGTEGVKVNQPIAILLEEGEDASSIKDVKKAELPPPAAAPQTQPEKKPELKVLPQASSEGRVFATPLARRIAEEAHLNLGTVPGSGPRGRIIRDDVEQALAQGSAAPAFRAAPSPLLSGYEPEYEVITPSNTRKVIARRLIEAKQTIPHFYLTVDCEIDALLKAREQINTAANGAYKLSVNDFVIKACALALKHVPDANSAWINDQVYHFKTADISVAVATDGGLITPIIRRAESKGLVVISNEMKELATKAREGKLKPQEFQGGTFSLSNMGMYGVKEFSAIINPPQACILAVGMGEERPVVKDGLLTSATMMSCTLSVDHRVVDGALGAVYLKEFKNLIENPVMMIL